MARWSLGFNAISEGVSVAPHQHAPLFEKTDDGLVLPHPWCMGFLKAMRLRFDDWQPLLDLGRVDHGLILPILLYCTDPLGRPMLGPPRESPETKVFVQNAYHDIALVIPAIRDFWMHNGSPRLNFKPDPTWSAGSGYHAAKTMDYILKRWAVFALFLVEGRICLTNNAAERGLGGIALGRKS